MKNQRFSTNISLYFENGTRYDHSYNKTIGTRMRSIEWCHFRWPKPWVTLTCFKVKYYSASNNSKCCNIELYLQWQTNNKFYMIYRSAPFLMTLNSPNTYLRSRLYLTVYILVTAQYIDIYTMENEHRNLYAIRRMVSFLVTLSDY